MDVAEYSIRMPTPMLLYNQIAARYGIDPTDHNAVDHFFTNGITALSQEERQAIFDELLRSDGAIINGQDQVTLAP